MADLEGDWEQCDEVMAQGLRIKAMNSGQDLHLRFETDDPVLQDEFSGQYGQSVLLWFSTKSSGHGLRIDFKPKADLTFTDAINNMDRSVTLLGPPAEGYPRPWTEGSEGIELSALMVSGTLVYELRLPLKPKSPGSFALDVKPGGLLDISIETSRLSEGLDEQAPVAPVAASQVSLSVGRHRRQSPSGAQSQGPLAAYSALSSVELALPPPGEK